MRPNRFEALAFPRLKTLIRVLNLLEKPPTELR